MEAPPRGSNFYPATGISVLRRPHQTNPGSLGPSHLDSLSVRCLSSYLILSAFFAASLACRLAGAGRSVVRVSSHFPSRIRRS
jgi:hypothetical protein